MNGVMEGPPFGRILSMPPLEHVGTGSARDCPFCRIIRGQDVASIVHEDIHSLAFMDIRPLYAGHSLVVSRRHYTDVLSTPEPVATHCMAVARHITAGIRRATGAAAMNLFCANGRAGGQDIPHFHIHVIPIPAGAGFPLQLPPKRPPAERSELDRLAEDVSEVLRELLGP